MDEKSTQPARRRRLLLLAGSVAGLFAIALIYFIMSVFSFLSVTRPVDANILVVEGWITARRLPVVVEEFRRHPYSHLLISGLDSESEEDQSRPEENVMLRTLLGLEALGVPREQIVVCPAPFVHWRRTASMARAVREKIHHLGLRPDGINVITSGTHARETWAAYRHMFRDETSVGIISIQVTRPDYRWWTSRGGVGWVTKDFLGWFKEVVLPKYS